MYVNKNWELCWCVVLGHVSASIRLCSQYYCHVGRVAFWERLFGVSGLSATWFSPLADASTSFWPLTGAPWAGRHPAAFLFSAAADKETRGILCSFVPLCWRPGSCQMERSFVRRWYRSALSSLLCVWCGVRQSREHSDLQLSMA